MCGIGCRRSEELLLHHIMDYVTCLPMTYFLLLGLTWHNCVCLDNALGQATWKSYGIVGEFGRNWQVAILIEVL